MMDFEQLKYLAGHYLLARGEEERTPCDQTKAVRKL